MSSAIISKCQTYRYRLERDVVWIKPLVFVMLNPSTADAEHDDPTIRRCRRFADDLGYTGIIVVNLYAFRATNPKELLYADDPIGPENNKYIKKACADRDVCCAWGNNGDVKRAAEVMQLITAVHGQPYCLGLTRAGMPRHPLYVKANQKLIKM